MTYAKLIDNQLQIAPNPILVDGNWIGNPPGAVSVEEWPAWVQPIGAQDAYNDGDKVSHNEKHWVSMTDANVWEPGVYGWEEVE